MARPNGFEPLTPRFVVWCSIQLSYGRLIPLPEIAAITGHSLRRAQDILDKYLARTSRLAESAIAKFENVTETDSAKRGAK